MINLFSQAIAHIYSLLKSLQVRQFFAIALVGAILLLAPAETTQNNPDLGRRIDNVLERSDSERPTTTRQWQQEAREVEGKPGERLKRIGEESKEAFKEFGGLYPDTAERTAETLKEESELRSDR
jgi:methylthioribose-1-phosphate isomerase